MKRFRQIEHRMCQVCLVLGGLSLVGLVLVMGGNVLLRQIGYPAVGANELSGLLGAFAIACGLADAQRQRMHVSVDLLNRRMPQLVQTLLAGFNALLFALFYGALGYMSWRYALRLRAQGELSETLRLSFHPVVYAVAAGFLLLALTLLLEFATLAADRRVAAIESGAEPAQ
ncbi:MAG: TRAP transporter small permease [Lentisphaeria bacterium]|nr:TRAP transporter small permease [Lentisphaeria bacterium]